MPRQSIVVLGDEITRQPGLASVVGQFDWNPEIAIDLDGLVKLCFQRDIVAVLLQSQAIDLPWKQALAAVRQAVPEAAVLLCHRFSEAIDWSEASVAGAFGLLHVPLSLSELRQNLGFVWAARNKRLHVIPSGAAETSRIGKSRVVRAHTSANVA